MAGACLNGKRVTVEWFFGGCGSRFPLILDEMHNRFLQVAIAAQISAAVVVNNAINCIEPSQTS